VHSPTLEKYQAIDCRNSIEFLPVIYDKTLKIKQFEVRVIGTVNHKSIVVITVGRGES